MSQDRTGHEWGVVDSIVGPDPGAGTTDAAGPRAGGTGTRVNVFPVGEAYLIREYFEESEVFEALEPFYDPRRYRFEIPEDDYEDAAAVLSAHGYDPFVVGDHAPFAVIVAKYTDHPEVVFEESVLEVSTSDHNVFVLADEAAVREAVEAGATRLTDTPLRLQIAGSPGVGST
ncbi:MAG: hypothetical protein V5A23_08975, partial [Halobacteriales archaeon]